MVLCLAWPSLNSADGNVSTGTLILFVGWYELLPYPPIIMVPVEVSGDKSWMGIRGRWAEKDVGEGLRSCKLEETRLEPGPRVSWQTPSHDHSGQGLSANSGDSEE